MSTLSLKLPLCEMNTEKAEIEVWRGREGIRRKRGEGGEKEEGSEYCRGKWEKNGQEREAGGREKGRKMGAGVCSAD